MSQGSAPHLGVVAGFSARVRLLGAQISQRLLEAPALACPPFQGKGGVKEIQEVHFWLEEHELDIGDRILSVSDMIHHDMICLCC